MRRLETDEDADGNDRMVVGLIGLVMSGLGMAAVLTPGFAEWYVR